MPTSEIGSFATIKKPTRVGQKDLSVLFRPKLIAVIGADPEVGVNFTRLWGREAVENIKDFGYPGKVVAVNPKYEEVFGYPCYPSIKSLPFVPDAVLVLRGGGAPTVSAIGDAAEIGVLAAITFATGFAETGADGAAAQARLADVARFSGMAVVGPNSSGLLNWIDRASLHLGSASAGQPGCVAVIAHGGGPNSLLGDKRGVRWSRIVSSGNEAVTGSADFLHYFVDDPHVRVICGFIETMRDSERFFFECDRAHAAGKPVIILKSGRSEAAREMAAAHAGALTAPYRLYRELFKRHGVVQVDSFEVLLASAIAMQARRSPGQGRLGVAHPSAGLLETIRDETAKCASLSYPNCESRTAGTLRSLVPGYRGCSNPIDTGAGFTNLKEANPKILQAVASDPNDELVLTHLDPNQLGTGPSFEHEVFADSGVRAAAASNKLVTVRLRSTRSSTTRPQRRVGRSVRSTASASPIAAGSPVSLILSRSS